MKYYRIICGVLVLAGMSMSVSCANDNASVSEEPENLPQLKSTDEGYAQADEGGFTGASPVEQGMEIIFEDDFNSIDGIPDPDKWILCERSTSNWARYLSGSYDQAYIKDGLLNLVGEKKDGEYLTGGIESRGKFEFEYGKVECRARFARMPMGGHTGIWMMPAPPADKWPKGGEIDIMEHLNHENIIYETIHSWYADDMGFKDDPVAQKEVTVNKEDWNIYGVEWTADKIIYTVNGVPHLEYPNLHLEGENGEYQWPFNHPFYLILSQSLGGQGTWAGAINDSELPAVFQIDWIRVTQPISTTGIPKITAD